jgi:hypothetical protein
MKVETENGTKFLETDTISTSPKIEVITKSVVPNITQQEQVNCTRRKTDTKLHQFTHSIESSWIKFINWFKKSIAMMMIFILFGATCGLYIAKILYDLRMDEIAQLAKNGSSGYIHKGQIFDVKLRP